MHEDAMPTMFHSKFQNNRFEYMISKPRGKRFNTKKQVSRKDFDSERQVAAMQTHAHIHLQKKIKMKW